MMSGRIARGVAALSVAMATLLAFDAADARPKRAVAAERSGIPPFCVRIVGPRGFDLPQICRFYDYQQCLRASADLHGNCVINIDYPGKITGAPGATWSQPGWQSTR